MFKGCDGRVCDARSLQCRDGLLPGFVCRLGRLLNIQLRRSLLITVECAEISGGGSLDDLRETRLQQGEGLPQLRLGLFPGCAVWLR